MIFWINIQVTAEKITVGSQVWVANPSVAWIDGEMLKIDGLEAEIQTSDGKKVSWSYATRKSVNFYFVYQLHHIIKKIYG